MYIYIPILGAMGKFRAKMPHKAGLQRRESRERLSPCVHLCRVGPGRQRCEPAPWRDGDGLRVPWAGS